MKGSDQQATAIGTRNPISTQIPSEHNLTACGYWGHFCTGTMIYPVEGESSSKGIMRETPQEKRGFRYGLRDPLSHAAESSSKENAGRQQQE